MGGHQSVGEWLIATGADPTSTNQMGEDFAYILRREVHSAWNN
jgi:hypothetical protein